MSNFVPTNVSQVIAQAISATETTQNVPLGMIITAEDKDLSSNRGVGEFIYLKGVASTAVGSVVVYNSDDYSTTLAAANAVGPIAVAMSACASGSFGWYQIQGKASAAALTGFADNADCYLTATPGSIDDADTAGDYIRGMLGAGAVSGGVADVEMWRPSVADGKDD